MSQIGSITAEKEKQMALERQKFQEAKAKMLAQQKYKRAARITGHIALSCVLETVLDSFCHMVRPISSFPWGMERDTLVVPSAGS